MAGYKITKDKDGNIVDIEVASVTQIIHDATPQPWGPPWGANCVCDWIKQYCKVEYTFPYDDGNEGNVYRIDDIQLEDARKNFRDVQQTALDVGSEVHAAIELFLKNRSFPEIENEQVLNGFSAFLDWFDENKVQVIHTEHTVYGPNWAGTLDLICWLNGVKTVIDFKSSKAFYINEMGPQIAAYRSCTDATASGILRLDKVSGTPQYKDFSKRYEKDLAIFNVMVELFYLRHPILRKKAGMPF